MNRLVTQEVRERYIIKAEEGTTAILQSDDEFVEVAAKFNAARAEESAARERLKRARNMTRHTMGILS